MESWKWLLYDKVRYDLSIHIFDTVGLLNAYSNFEQSFLSLHFSKTDACLDISHDNPRELIRRRKLILGHILGKILHYETFYSFDKRDRFFYVSC